MMFRPIILAFSFFLGFQLCCLSQIANLPGTLNKPLRTVKLYEQTKGSPFFRDVFLKGKLIDKNGSEREIFLKYDTYMDQVQVSGEHNVMIIDKSYYPRFVIEEVDSETGEISRFMFTNLLSLEGHDELKYAQVLLVSPNVEILKTIKTVLIKSEEKGYGGNRIAPHFEQKIAYYLFDRKTQSIYSISLKTNQIIKTLAQYDGIKAYFKSNKIRIREESDLGFLIEFMNSHYSK